MYDVDLRAHTHNIHTRVIVLQPGDTQSQKPSIYYSIRMKSTGMGLNFGISDITVQ